MDSETAFSPADVAAAVSRYLGADVNRPELRSIAARVSLQGIRLLPGADLARSGDFHSRVLAAGGEELTRLVDPQKLERLRLEAEGREALPYARFIHGRFVYGDGWLSPWLAAREVEDGGNGYGALANLDLAGSPQMASALHHADRCGMGWLRQNRELLQLGPAAIQTLVEARFRRESFQRLRNAGYNRQEAAELAVNISRYAIRTGQDANRIAESVEENVRIFGGDNPEERRRWREMLKKFYTTPDDPAARDALNRALTDMETRGTPAQREQARRQREIVERQATARAEVSTAATVAQVTEDRAQARVAEDEALLAEFNAPTPATPAATPPAAPASPAPAPAEPRPATVRTAIHATAAPT